ncbi:MAG: hypothetical protein IIA61_01790 [Candidatus Marinimicrobia bacterium]|nr:hypothetical protein [Candidatus Neomarinimicrobiota bacterium]
MRCKHGTYIHSDWRECYECVREDEADEANRAAIEAAEEAKRQTEILRRLVTDKQEKSKKEKELEAQIAELRADIERLKRNK